MSSGFSPKLTVSGRNLPILERTKVKNRRLKNKIADIKTYETELDDEESQIEHVIANHYLDYKRQKNNKKFDRKLKRWRDVTSCFSDREILQIPSFSFPRFGENFPWRGRQTLCKNYNNEIISEEFKKIRNTSAVEEFSNLLKRHNKVRNNFENKLNPISYSQQQLNGKNSNENIETFIGLASQCYSEGFQVHLNFLEECSRRAILLKKRFGTEISTRKKINENHRNYKNIYIENCDENYSDNTEEDDENILSVLSVNLTEREIGRKIKFSEIMSSSDVETFKKFKKNTQFNDFNYNSNIEPPKIILTDFSKSSEDGGLKSTILLPSQNYQYSYDNEEIKKLGLYFNGLKIPNDNYRSESRPP